MDTFILIAVLFCSTLIRSTFGFGDALVAMPLLAVSLGMRTATPLVALVASTIAVAILAKSWRDVRWASAWRLVLSTAAGIPLGLLFLKGSHEDLMKIILASVIITYSTYSLVKPRLLTLKSEKAAFPFGFIAGILGGAYNTNGPPVVVYGTLRGWAPHDFRTTLQGYFLPTGLMIVLGHGLSGLWTQQVFKHYLIALPAVLIAIFLGSRLNRAIPKGRFDRYIHLLLIAIGIFLLLQSIR